MHTNYKNACLILPRVVDLEVRQEQAQDRNLEIIITEMESLGSGCNH